jgi:hypothetical protein
MPASQRFNVDVRFLYGTLLEDAGKDTARPSGTTSVVVRRSRTAWSSGRTDWNRRATELPVVSKSITNWTGKPEVGEISFSLADTDNSVYSTFYGSVWASVSPLGNPVGFYSKVSENPEYYLPIFSGVISKVERSRGKTKLTIEDSMRNLYNSQFVADYAGIATFIGDKLYGTLKDVQGTTFYMDDRGDGRLVKQSTEDDRNWFAIITGAIVGGALGFITGGLGALAAGAALTAGPAVVGGVSGAITSIPKGGSKENWFIKVNDYNAIPDGVVFGGQNLKFYPGTVDGRANGIYGSLYGTLAMKVRSGTFQYGIFGTMEVDELFHNVKKGDYVYAELPLIYWGSPDDIIRNMLTGSNSTVRWSFPGDFSDSWFDQTTPLRHIEAWANVSNFEVGGVMDAIDSMCKEFGFNFYIDESNRFAVRSIRPRALTSSSVIGTLSEGYNVVEDGFTRVDDIKSGYTDINIKFKNEVVGGEYDQELRIPLYGAATYYGGLRRPYSIDSKWIHDSLTGQFAAKRLARRYGTVSSSLEGDVVLNSLPISLGDVVSCTGWAVGTARPFETMGYEKDFGANRVHVKLEDVTSLYDSRGFFYISATTNSVATSGDTSAFGTIMSTLNMAPSLYGLGGTLLGSIGYSDTELTFYSSADIVNAAGLNMKFADGHEEIIYVHSISNDWYVSRTAFSPTQHYITYKVIRGMFDTLSGTHAADQGWSTAGLAIATCLMSGGGTIFRWY